MKTWLLIATLALAACSRARESEASEVGAMPTAVPVAQPQAVATPAPSPTRVWLDGARDAHGYADGAQGPWDRDAAIAKLRAAAALAVPPPVSAEEAAGVKRGLYAHAAKLALELGHTEDAETLIQDGLTLPGSDPMRSQLLLLTVELARERGDTKAEGRARKQAAAGLGLERTREP